MICTFLISILLPDPPISTLSRDLTQQEVRSVLDELQLVYQLSVGSPDGNPAVAVPMPTSFRSGSATEYTRTYYGNNSWRVTLDAKDGSLKSFAVHPYPWPDLPLGAEPLSAEAATRIAGRLANRHQIGGYEVVTVLDAMNLKDRQMSFSLQRSVQGIPTVGLGLYGALDPYSGLPVHWSDFPAVSPSISPRADPTRVTDKDRAWSDAMGAYLAFNPHPYAVAGRHVTLKWACPIDEATSSQPDTWVSAYKRTSVYEREAAADQMALFYYLSVDGVMPGRLESQSIMVDAMTGEVAAILTVPLLELTEKLASVRSNTQIRLGEFELFVNGKVMPVRATVAKSGDPLPADPNAMLVGSDGAIYPVRMDGSNAKGAGFSGALTSETPIPKARALREFGQ